MEEQQISPLVQKQLDRLDNGEMTESEMNRWRENATKTDRITEYEREIFLEKLETRIRNSYPVLSKKLFGSKDLPAVEALQNILNILEEDFDLSGNLVKSGIKVGGDQVSGRKHVSRHFSYKNNDGWSAGIGWLQDSPESDPFWSVAFYQKGRVSNPDSIRDDIFAIDDTDGAITKIRDHFLEICPLK